MDLSGRIDRTELHRAVAAATGMKASPRLAACVDIVWFFAPFGQFGRLEVVGPRSGLAEIYHSKVLDRALRDLLAAGVLTETDRGVRRGGGRTFLVARLAKWGTRGVATSVA
jgi:hypothetical protein